MEEPMLTATQHQRIDRYLAELDGALGGLPETERADVVAGVREHIEAALTDRGGITDDDVDEVLRALGDPLTIAAGATGDDGGSPGPATVASEDDRVRTVPMLQRDWVPGFVMVGLLIGPLVLTLLATIGGIFLLPFVMLGGWAVLWISPLWTPLEKLAGTFLLPGVGILLFVGLFTTGSTEVCGGGMREDGSTYQTCTTDGWLTPMVFWITFVAVAALSIGTAYVLYRNGRRRTAALAQSFSTGA
ncbi:hypothetical protein E1212_19090 [Jiangella ureilytica]|uniref:DUF1700 domain-containing protein n=1 Tax=Jiangella ureilytica TaxID=2530374 RepID=A0A4R4RI57_9ACTN|nr:hypothetical protein [Jiangella ureilytica]TDC49201.1 hypothetical protein E1212_19090 [Jiangella ureilytica]